LRAAARRRLARGHRLDERDVRERRARDEGAAARVGRRRPDRGDRPALRAMKLGQITTLSDPGRKRRRNEDSFVCEPPLFAVADGMGGAQAGEIASRLAAGALREDAGGSGQAGEARVVGLIQEANRRVYQRAGEDEAFSGMGTTVTAALVEGAVVWIGHVG